MKETIPVGTFQAQCLRIMDEVHRTHKHVVITKDNEPFVELIPIAKKKQQTLAEWLDGTVHIHGDIISLIDEVWIPQACSKQ